MKNNRSSKVLFRCPFALLLLSVAAFVLWTAMGTQTQGATSPPVLYIVDSTGDGDNVSQVNTVCDDGTGHCTLRAALEASNSHVGTDTIVIDIPTSDPGYRNGIWTISLTQALPVITDAVNISGPGADKLTVQPTGVNGAYRVFEVTASGTVTFSGLTIAHGMAPYHSDGGGIRNTNTGTVNVSNCILTGNSTVLGNGGAISNFNGTVNVSNSMITGNSPKGDGGGIVNSGALNVTHTTISSNSASYAGGGIVNRGGVVNITSSNVSGNSATLDGGGILNFGTLYVTNSTVTGNQARGGGGISNGNFSVQAGTANVTNSTINDNSAGIDGGAGIANWGTANVTNTTIGGNSSYDPGGGIYNANIANVSNCTVSGNLATKGGGGFYNARGSANFKSSIVALNVASSSGPDVFGSFISYGFNLIGKTDGSTGFTAPTDLTGTIAAPLDPKLGALQYNGGPTNTMALLSGSPAIDKGTSVGLTGTLVTDQRGVGYKRTINKSNPNAAEGDGTDIGAFELGAQINAVSSKAHGGAGTFNVSLPLFGPKVGIECRKGSVFKVILTFPSAVTLSNVSVTPDPHKTTTTANVSSFSVTGPKVTVNLSGVSQAQTITVHLLNVSDGTNTNDVSVPMGVLLGDTDSNRSVTSTDVSLTQSKVGQAISTSNFREDVNLDGVINSTDVQQVQSKVGTKLP